MDKQVKMTKAFPSDVTVVEGERAVVATITTNIVDRDGEVLIPQGCNSKEFEQNPVVFFAHSYADYFRDDTGAKLPVGQCTSIKRNTDSIVAKTVFATRPDTYPEDKEWLPDTLFALYQQKVLRGFSVGLIPMETRPATDKDVADFGAGVRRVVSKWKMLEYSVAPIPCNQEAITMAVSKGFLKQDAAEKLFGKIEPKAAEDEVQACAGCGAMTPSDELMAMEDKEGMYCKECRGQKTADPTQTVVEPPGQEKSGDNNAEPVEPDTTTTPKILPDRVVVRTIEPEQEDKLIIVHRTIKPPKRQRELRKMVFASIAKRRGRID